MSRPETVSGVEGAGKDRPDTRRSLSAGKHENSRALQSAEVRTKAAESMRRRAALYNTTGPSTERRAIGEIRKLPSAVAAFCRECCGHDPAGLGSMKAAVEDCRGDECHLYLWRNGMFHTDEAEAEVEALAEQAQ